MIKKHQLKEKYETLQSAFAAVVKAKSAADQKMVSVSMDYRFETYAVRLRTILSNTSKPILTSPCMLATSVSAVTQRFVRLDTAEPHLSCARSCPRPSSSENRYPKPSICSPDTETGKVAHVNFLPQQVLTRKVLDAKTWLGEVSQIIGGKVSGSLCTWSLLYVAAQGGGKDDSATGVGADASKVPEAIEVAKRVYKSRVEGA